MGIASVFLPKGQQGKPFQNNHSCHFPDHLLEPLHSSPLLRQFLEDIWTTIYHTGLFKRMLSQWETAYDLFERYSPCVGPRLEVRKLWEILFIWVDYPDRGLSFQQFVDLWAKVGMQDLTPCEFCTLFDLNLQDELWEQCVERETP